MIKFVKTKIIGGKVDDVVDTLEIAKTKSKWLMGNLYTNGMLILVKDKNAIYRVKEI